MQIYWIKAQAPRRVLALVKYLGIDAELIELDLMAGALQQPDYAALNPNRKAPTLVDGDTVLWESAAIMAHLCVEAKSDLWPARNPAQQIEVLRWLAWSDSHWSPAVAPFYFEHIVKSTFGIGAPDIGSLPAKIPNLHRFAAVLNQHLAGAAPAPQRNYLACDRLTIADFYAASMAAYWREAQMPLADFPHIVRWLDGLMRIPAWAEPWPQR